MPPEIRKASVIEPPYDAEPEIGVLHRIPTDGIVSFRPEVLVEEIITQKQIDPLDGGSGPDIDDRISRKFDPGIVLVKLAQVDRIRWGTERGVETYIQSQVEVHRPAQVTIVV